MNLKSLSILIFVLVISVVTYYINTSQNNKPLNDNSHLIHNLSKELNSVEKLTILKAGGVLLTEISASEKNWVVVNRGGYEADITAVRNVFNNLSEAKLIEKKTSNPKNYSKIGVEDITDINAQGVQFSIEGLSKPTSIIVGKEGSSGKNTQFVRRTGEKQSWLIDKKLNMNRDVTQWLRTDILDIPPERIKSVNIQHPDGSVVEIENKNTEEYEFMLISPLQEGRQVSESEIYQVANALSSLQLRDVTPIKDLNKEAIQPIVTTFTTYDGITVIAKSFTIKEETYSILGVEFDNNKIDEYVSKKLNKLNPVINFDPKNAKEFSKEITPRLKGWAFVLPAITQDALVKKLEDLSLDEAI